MDDFELRETFVRPYHFLSMSPPFPGTVATNVVSSTFLVNRPFYRYGRHFDFYCFERHYGMLRGQINVYLPPGHPIIAIRNNRNQNGRRIGKKVH